MQLRQLCPFSTVILPQHSLYLQGFHWYQAFQEGYEKGAVYRQRTASGEPFALV